MGKQFFGGEILSIGFSQKFLSSTNGFLKKNTFHYHMQWKKTKNNKKKKQKKQRTACFSLSELDTRPEYALEKLAISSGKNFSK